MKFPDNLNGVIAFAIAKRSPSGYNGRWSLSTRESQYDTTYLKERKARSVAFSAMWLRKMGGAQDGPLVNALRLKADR